MFTRTQTEVGRRTTVALALAAAAILPTACEDPFQDPYEEQFEVRAAAVQGNAEAQYALGRIYHNGEGVPQHDSEAVR